jgi:hypothetical protein
MDKHSFEILFNEFLLQNLTEESKIDRKHYLNLVVEESKTRGTHLFNRPFYIDRPAMYGANTWNISVSIERRALQLKWTEVFEAYRLLNPKGSSEDVMTTQDIKF